MTWCILYVFSLVRFHHFDLTTARFQFDVPLLSKSLVSDFECCLQSRIGDVMVTVILISLMVACFLLI